MGTDLGKLVPAKEIRLADLSGKRVAIDAFNVLYQFLSTIRQPDGMPLVDSQGRITSHLTGLFYRTISLIESGIWIVFVFDGEPPRLKAKEIENRRKIREESYVKWKTALSEGRIEEAYKAARASSRLSDDIIDSSKQLLSYMGIPFIEAPSEGEAQAAYLVCQNKVWSSASQDFDSLLFGSPRLVRNLTLSERRKLPGKNIYVQVYPALIELDIVLSELGISREQLIDIGILIGTDFNDKIPGVGPKTALKLIKKYGSFEKIVQAKNYTLDFDYNEVREIFLHPKVNDVDVPEIRMPDPDKITQFLCEEHDFSKERVERGISRLVEAYKIMKGSGVQTSLEDFF